MKYNICISGAAAGASVKQSCGLAYQLGQAIAQEGHITTTGATVGLPYFAARGAVENSGQSIGFSPASSVRSHVKKYRLPLGVYDYIVYTGMSYMGRDVQLVMSSDAIITVGGRVGSLHEFTTAIEAHKPCGVLLESGGTADFIPAVLEALEEPASSRVVFDTDPKKLVAKVVELLDKDYADMTDKVLSRHEDLFEGIDCHNVGANGRAG